MVRVSPTVLKMLLSGSGNFALRRSLMRLRTTGKFRQASGHLKVVTTPPKSSQLMLGAVTASMLFTGFLAACQALNDEPLVQVYFKFPIVVDEHQNDSEDSETDKSTQPQPSWLERRIYSLAVNCAKAFRAGWSPMEASKEQLARLKFHNAGNRPIQVLKAQIRATRNSKTTNFESFAEALELGSSNEVIALPETPLTEWHQRSFEPATKLSIAHFVPAQGPIDEKWVKHLKQMAVERNVAVVLHVASPWAHLPSWCRAGINVVCPSLLIKTIECPLVP